ncbi:DUF1769-domain-containing protein [Aspergillus ellipticus CBS 707.79]|uniref:DUF1769-domain-containing protein n=1 Tax=Aspergillus ellipticus CBS 707.79 TaxID=1448320 RepID=A0A319E2X2_9EURO|nr:DUF1769-domain-containing protein [Aspergillus ellipticus CBS 707.79]
MFSSNPLPPNHRLKITAGTSYSPSTHQPVSVNSTQPFHLESDLISTDLWVRIQDFTHPSPQSSKTNPYFTSSPHHPRNKNLYSLTFTLRFPPRTTVNGNALLFGNDFDHPIREYLPPGFGTGLRIVKSTLDPSLEGDVYAEKPYLLSPGLAGWNFLEIGGVVGEDGDEEDGDGDREGNLIVEEGARGSGVEVRKTCGIPDDADARKRYFHDEQVRKGFEFEGGRVYKADFGNPYLDFNAFAIRLPGISFHVGKYVTETNNVLRYVLKNRETGEVYFVVCFTVDLDSDGDGEEDEEEEEEDDEGDVSDDEDEDDEDGGVGVGDVD